MDKHIPVLLNESISLLNIRDGSVYVDLTLGRAGHSREILKRIPHGRLVAFDQDETAIRESRPRLEEIGDNFTLIKANFAEMKERLEEIGITKVDGILADLGVSSPQLDEGSRGFSYNLEAPLDMRMDLSSPLTAKKVVNTYSLNDLTRILRDYGEEKDAYKIAKTIVSRRVNKPLETTIDLVEAVKASKSAKELSKKGHPAKQTFQAIRMEVNQETKTLERMLEVAPSLLAPKGRLAIITFMSLDDRMVKRRFAELTKIEGDRHGIDIYSKVIEEAPFLAITKKPVVPSEEELERNHRAKSSKLRVIEAK
ncbi:MAG: 16S rRNA (cytosine(1402)-N(4))-methyltransferase RsmH [Bacilli bacterium]|nr:16S rRNA (cytosine(1402)-N(4))-methyltransferase RsmH [Bacilli bacterium]